MTDGYERRKAASVSNTPGVQCQGKARFESFTATNLVQSRRSGKTRRGRQRYRCGCCGGWHLGARKL